MEKLTEALLQDDAEKRFNELNTTDEEDTSQDDEAGNVHDRNGNDNTVSFMDLVDKGNVEGVLLDRQNSLRRVPLRDRHTVKVGAMNCQIFGTPYANNKTWWCRVLPLAILIGIVASLFSMIFLAGYSVINKIFFGRRDVGEEGGISVGKVGLMQGEWWWIAVTTAGALLANLVWYLPGAPTWMECETTFNALVVMKGNLWQKPYFVLHCFIGLSCGASAGPAMSLSALGCAYGELVSNVLNERDQKLILLCGFAAAFSPAMPTPFHAVLLALELFIVANAGDTTLHKYDTDRMVMNPIIPGRNLHDHMEKICTMGASVLSGYIVFRTLIEYSIDKDDDEELANVAEIHTYHMFSAILIGIICAAMAAFFIQMKGFFKAIRVAVTSKLFFERQRLPKKFEPFIFPILGGLFYGFIVVCFPLVAGGLKTNREIVTLSLNRTLDGALLNGYDEDNDEQITPTILMLSCFFKLVGTACNLGWCWLGGAFFPLSTAGSFLGASLDIWAPDVFPAKMALPCCMIGITASYMPLTLLMLAIVSYTTGDPIITTCAFITAITGYTLLMGSGFIHNRAFTRIQGVLDKYDAKAGTDLYESDEYVSRK